MVDKKGVVLATTSTFGLLDRSPINRLEHEGYELLLNPHGRKLSETESVELFLKHRPVGIVAGTENLTRSTLARAVPHLRVISRAGVGMDNVDLEAAKELGIKVFSTPDAPTDAVAELAVGLMLSVLRKIGPADRGIRSGKWKPEMGSLLKGRTVGIVGVGRIGRRLANILQKGFEANVIGYDPFLNAPETQRSPCPLTKSLEELLGASNVISLHIPKPKGNSYFIGAKEISIMKKDAVIINSSRGGLIDETALKSALDQKLIGGAGLDVFEVEPYDGPLKESENVVLSAHMGSYAKESRIRMEAEAVQNLLQGLGFLE